MKKLLIILIIVLLITLISVTLIKGLSFWNLNFLAIKDLKQKNNELDATIQEATKLASTDYQKSITDLNQTLKQLESKKEQYNDAISVSTDTDLKAALQIEYYPIEYLWVTIGKYAKDESVKIKMVPSVSIIADQNLYNLNFTVTGSYIRISNFIRDIEDDESLGFKIEEFNMLPSDNTSTLEATFVCKNLRLSGISSVGSEVKDNVESESNNQAVNKNNTSNTTKD